MSGARDGESTEGQRPAGPVTGQGSSSSQAAGEDPNPAPPTGATASKDSETPSADAKDSGAPPSQAVEKDLDALLADVQRERDEYLDLAKRTKADFENYRKRMAAEVAAATARGKAALVGELIHVIDNLERALQAAGIDAVDEAARPGEPLAQGILLTYRELCAALQRAGVEPLEAAGEKFDPNLHEALSTRAADGAEAGTVVDVMQKGYRLGEQLIRPARVVVAE